MKIFKGIETLEECLNLVKAFEYIEHYDEKYFYKMSITRISNNTYKFELEMIE